MAKNNVGSLYYEILLSPSGYKKGAAAVRKEDSNLQNYLTKSAKESLSERDKIRAEAERAARHNWEKNANDPELRAKISKAIVETAKRRLAEVKRLEDKARMDKYMEDKAAAQRKRVAVIEGMKKLIAKQKVIDDKAREEKRKADERAARNAPRTGIMGTWDKFQGLAGKIGTVTMAIWPLTQAFNFLSRSVGSVVNVFMSWMKIIDDFKMSVKNMALQMGGNVKAAKELSRSIEEYAAKTSLSVQSGLDMANSLLVMGVNADFVTIRLRQFNKVAQGNADKFNRIAKAYTDVVAAGTLKMTELRQFTEAHVPIREFLTKALKEQGRFTGNLDKMISDRLVTITDVSKALDMMGEKYSDADYFGLDTVSGQLENISEEMTIWLRHSEAGVAINQKMVSVLSGLSKLIDRLAGGWGKFSKILESSYPLTSKFIEGLAKVADIVTDIERGMRGILRIKSFLEYGDWFKLEKELELLEYVDKKNQERLEKEARARADQAAEMEAADNAKLERAKKYAELMDSLQVKADTAQAGYDQWAKENNVAQYDTMGQFELNMAYIARQQAEADQARQDKLDQLSESASQRAASTLEKALNAALPQSAFKQNSVEEFRYLQQQRKQAERDRRDQEKFDKKWEQDQNNANRQYEATIGIVTTTDTTISL